jgi:phage shock protein PspC (stress-responsive transcriptional regulator)
MLKKLSSRKFWAAAAGFVAGLAMVFGLDETIIHDRFSAVVAVGSVIAYI